MHYLDEAVFCSRLDEVSVWAPKGNTFRPKLSKKLKFPAVYALATINCDGKITGLDLKEVPITADIVVMFLGKLRASRPKEKTVFVFLDNLPAHHSKKVTTFCVEHKIELIFNATYSSEYNCIEFLWRLSKINLRRELITQSNLHRKSLIKRLVQECILQAVPQSLKAHHDKCVNRMRNYN